MSIIIVENTINVVEFQDNMVNSQMIKAIDADISPNAFYIVSNYQHILFQIYSLKQQIFYDFKVDIFLYMSHISFYFHTY
mgnify:CR=1 FL=1